MNRNKFFKGLKSQWYIVALIFIFLLIIIYSMFITTDSETTSHEKTEIEEHEAEYEVNIGILSKRGAPQFFEQWGETAVYLNRKIPEHNFTIIPLHFDELDDIVESAMLDFVLVNSSMFVELQVNHGASSILTLKNKRSGDGYLFFGGTIFTKADNDDINNLSDLKGKTFTAVSKNSFGGWQMAWKELLDNDIDPYTDFAGVSFSGTHDTVVYDVLNGKYEAGTVRSNTLERMDQEGFISIEDIKVLNEKTNSDFPFLHSTELYPEWPLGKLAHVSNELAHDVALALMEMTPEDKAAVDGEIEGWTVSQNYQSVTETLKSLQLSPYEDYGKITLKGIIVQYRLLIDIIFILLIVVMVFLVRLSYMKTRLQETLSLSRKLERKAQDASNAKSEFLAHMSHEIRTPMNAVIGLSTLMFKTNLSLKQLDYNKKINSSAKNLLGIINNILDFSKIEARGMELENIEFNLNDVLYNLSNLITLKAEQKNIEFLFDISKDVPYKLFGDPLRLGQVLTNLSNNAIKFTDEGQIVIGIRVNEITENNITLQFEVRDTGIGMTKEQLNKIFRPFTQADSSMTRNYGGTGLGLIISKQFVELMGGEISVRSTYGEGSTFTFNVIMGFDPASDSRLVTPEALSHLNVLVIDDNKTARDILRSMLESFGFSTREASSGKEALSLIEEKTYRPDLFILDYKMPGMDGLETAEKMFKTEDSAIPQILMISAFGNDSIKEKAVSLGISSFLEKPVNPSCLFDTIIALFAKKDVLTGSRENLLSVKSNEVDKIRGANILLAEDNLINQQIAHELLTEEGMNVTTALNGVEVIEILNKASEAYYDVILMDIQMPVMDGREATRDIRKSNKGYKDIPIIAMTAHALADEKAKNLETGMNDHITKPIDLDILFKSLITHVTVPEERKLKKPYKEGKLNSSEFQIPIIPGFNTDEAMKRVSGKIKLFNNLIRSFYSDYRDIADKLRLNQEKGHYKENEIIVHTIKGISGNLGAVELYDAAGELEKSYKFETDNQKLLDVFENKLKYAMEGMEAYIADINASKESDKTEGFNETSYEKALEVSGLLIKQLSEFDSDALTTVVDLKKVISSAGRKQLAEAEEKIENLLFEEASVIIEDIRTRMLE